MGQKDTLDQKKCRLFKTICALKNIKASVQTQREKKGEGK